MRRSVGLALTAAAASSALVAAALPAQAAPGRAPSGTAGYRPHLNWKSCNDSQNPRLLCAKLEVPLDHARPDGPKIKIAVNRLPATAPAGERQGPILLNPGGPGISGLWMAPWVPSKLPADVAASYDWIGFDLRGTQGSEPHMACDPHYFDGPRPDYQPSAGTEGAWLRKAAGYAADCAAKYADLLPHLRTVDIVRDMDDIRRALGAGKISFFGWSYGTTLGSTYGQLFPGHVKRLVLDSIVGPHISWYEQNVRQDLQHEKRFKAFTQWVAKADGVYHLGTDAAGVERKWYAMRASLGKTPVDGKIGADEWDDTQLAGGYDPAKWPRLATVLAAYTNSNDAGPLRVAYNRYAAPDPNDDSFDLYNAVQCSDSTWPRDWSFWRKDQARIDKKAHYYTYSNMWYNAACVFWAGKGGERTRITGKGLPAALLFQATEDAATVYQGGVEMAKAMPNSRFVVEQGGGRHAITLAGNACLDKPLIDYLRDGTLPKDHGLVDLRCAKSPDPTPTWVGVTKAAEQPSDNVRPLDNYRIR
ncbi:alpha/beta hydrolase [Actinomadura logoneensis]|uniref:Alpha/beta hydrolase n=1 Tax=Actinomadura logoneensis TaxID=2293572 RepID=A0A372JR51_9ACTN|nr:alpha/beta hydrolase [Actinomadura logoneensis]RFU42429.1 alpha/beta hydrolase [Actinomadura logoneensis]